MRSGGVRMVRQITLADDTNKMISLGIWGDYASKFDLGSDEHPVVAIKRGILTDYLGRSLNSNEDS